MVLNQNNLKKLNNGLTKLFHQDLKVPDDRPYLLADMKFFYVVFKCFNYGIMSSALNSVIASLTMALKGMYVRVYAIELPLDWSSGIFMNIINFDTKPREYRPKFLKITELILLLLFQ